MAMAITLCLLVGTVFIALYFYNKFYYKPPVIPNTIKAKVVDCVLSQSKLAKKMRADDCPYNLYDVTYEWEDKTSGETVQVMETRKYREEIGVIKDMIIERKSNGHQELIELNVKEPHHIWIYLAIGLVSYAFIGFFYFQEQNPEFIINLKGNGLVMLVGFGLLIGAMLFFEKFNIYKNLLLDEKVTKKYTAEIVKINPVLKKNGKPSKYNTLIFKYTDDGKETTFEDPTPLKLKKGTKIGETRDVYLDKKTGDILRLQTALSYRKAGATALTCGASCVAIAFVTTIVQTM